MTIKDWNKIFDLSQKLIVVTGAGLIGKELIKGLASMGGQVIIGEKEKKKGRELEDLCIREGLNVHYENLDIFKEESVDEFISNILKRYKKIDGWVNTAYPRTKDWGHKDQLLNYNSWKKNVNLHLGGYYLTSIKAAEIMKKQKFGSIINFSSIYGISAPDFSIYENTNMTTPIPYPAIKGGIIMLTKYIASFYGKYKIRANVIAPGGIYDNQPKDFVNKYISKTPLGRMGRAEDIVGTVIFLMSDASNYITGTVHVIDGGWTI